MQGADFAKVDRFCEKTESLREQPVAKPHVRSAVVRWWRKKEERKSFPLIRFTAHSHQLSLLAWLALLTASSVICLIVRWSVTGVMGEFLDYLTHQKADVALAVLCAPWVLLLALATGFLCYHAGEQRGFLLACGFTMAAFLCFLWALHATVYPLAETELKHATHREVLVVVYVVAMGLVPVCSFIGWYFATGEHLESLENTFAALLLGLVVVVLAWAAS